MELLWVTPQIPGCRSGGQVRQYYLLRYLCQKHRVTVLTLVQEDEVGEVATLEKWGVRVIAEPFTPRLLGGAWRNRLRSWTQLLLDPLPHYARVYPLEGLAKRLAACRKASPDLVHFEQLFTAPLARQIGRQPWVLAEQNVENLNAGRQWSTMTSRTRRLWGRIDSAKLKRWERVWVRRSPGCIAVSEADAAELASLSPVSRLFVVPNGVDAAGFEAPTPRDDARAGLIFLGNLGYRPNTDALLYFCREILARIQACQADTTLTIVGSHAPPEVVALGALPGVNYVGFVDDVRPFLWQASACVVPLRSGGGTRYKILESLAAGCPVVSTSVGAEGLELGVGEDLLIADTPNAFAAATVQLLTDREQWCHLAARGRATVTRLYDWRVIAPRLEMAYHEVVAAGACMPHKGATG